MSRKGYPQTNTAIERAGQTISYFDGSQVDQVFDDAYPSYEKEAIGPNSANWPRIKTENDFQGWTARARWEPTRVSGTIGGVGYATYEGTYPTHILANSLDILHGFDDDNGLRARLFDAVVAKLQSRLKNQTVNLGVLAAEFRKTCGTVTSAAQRIASAFQRLKRGDLGGAASVLGGGRAHGGNRGRSPGGGGGKPPDRRRRPRNPGPNTGSVASDWLAYQYGWKPLLSDVYGACEEMARTLNYEPPKVRATAICKGKEDKEIILPPIAPHCPPVRATRKISASVRGYVEYEVASSALQTLTNTGILNPLSIAWELVPFSFVADWFLPVGNFLNNLDYNHGLIFSRGWITMKSGGSWQVKPIAGQYVNVGLGYVSNYSGGSGSSDVSYFERKILTSGLGPVKFPPFKNPLSYTHAANAIALLRTVFGS